MYPIILLLIQFVIYVFANIFINVNLYSNLKCMNIFYAFYFLLASSVISHYSITQINYWSALLCPFVCVAVSFRQSSDILMMMDSSASVGQKNFELSKTFVDRLAGRFLSAQRERGATVRVAVGQYSRTARMEQGLTSNFTLLSNRIEKAAFQNDGTNVLDAMDFAIKNLPGRGDASGSRRKLVLFSDGRSQGVTEAVLEKRVRELAEAGVELFVITVGSQVNEVNLLTLVSRGRRDDNTYAQRHLFRVPDYPSLLRGVFYQTVSRRVSIPLDGSK